MPPSEIFFTFFEKGIDKSDFIIYNNGIEKGCERKDADCFASRELRRGGTRGVSAGQEIGNKCVREPVWRNYSS